LERLRLSSPKDRPHSLLLVGCAKSKTKLLLVEMEVNHFPFSTSNTFLIATETGFLHFLPSQTGAKPLGFSANCA
jgi:hypothetical protein